MTDHLTRIKNIAGECLADLRKDSPVDEVLLKLRNRGLSKIESIQALMIIRPMSLADAKRIVHGSPAWEDVRQDHDQMIDAALGEKRDPNAHQG
jgi:ribosomal protein L7/L12